MIVVQCWDDGVTADVRLTELLRRYGAKASFNLNPGLMEAHRTFGWMHQGVEVRRLGWSELRSVYEGFTIANHSLTHPRLDLLPPAAVRREIGEARDRLRQFFGQPIQGFAYPFGSYSPVVKEMVAEAGHAYARTGGSATARFPPPDPLEWAPSSHFLAADFWRKYEEAKAWGVFHFWGHAYEMISEPGWSFFEYRLARMQRDPESRWGELPDLASAGPGPAGRAGA